MKRRMILYMLSTATIYCISLVARTISESKAYSNSPVLNAEGFGANSMGGKGGDILWVTNLRDDGPGSFRIAATASGPRIIKFKVGGIIQLTKPIWVRNGRLTIDGTSAADKGGITLYGYGIIFAGLECRDVIVQHLRVRRAGKAGDCIAVQEGAHRVLIDHCSVSWADDENFGINKGHYITVQWCIIAEGLIEGTHPKGPHSCGMLVAHGANHVSIHHNFFTNNTKRNALLYGVGGTGSGGIQPGSYPGEEMAIFMPTAVFDFRNNLVYNFEHGTIIAQGAHVNVVNNFYRYGPDSKKRLPIEISLKTYYPGSEQPKVYSKGNIGLQRPRDIGEDWVLVRINEKAGSSPLHRSYEPFLVPPVKTHSAKQARDLVLKEAGAHPRDDVDLRLIEEYSTGKGKIGYGYLEWKKKYGL